MTENPLQCPKCHTSNFVRIGWRILKCPGCGHEEEYLPSQYIGCIKNTDKDNKIENIKQLIRAGNPNMVVLLLPYLTDSDPFIVRSVETFLFNNKSCCEDILINSFENLEPDVQIKFVGTLGLLQLKTIPDILIKKMETRDEKLKIALIRTSGQICDKNAVPALLKLLNTANEAEKREIIIALGNIGDKMGTPALLQILNTADQNLKNLIIESLGKIGDIKAAGVIAFILVNNGNQKIRDTSAKALIRFDNPNVIDLIIDAVLLNTYLVINPYLQKNLEKILCHYGKESEQLLIKEMAVHKPGTCFNNFGKKVLYKIDPKKYKR